MKKFLFVLLATLSTSFADDLDYGVGRLEWMGLDQVDMDNGSSMSYDRFTIQSGLRKPYPIAAGIKLFPAVRYIYTDVSFSDFALREFHDLHLLEFPLHYFRAEENNPWIFDFRITPGIASDMTRIKSKDLFIESTGGAVYRFSEKFAVNFGLAYTRVLGSPTVIPYAGFDWQPSEALRMTLHGAAFDARYEFADDWQLRLNARSAGGLWNVDTATWGHSKFLDVSSFRVGLSMERRLKDEWWIYAGAGTTFNNQIELRDTNDKTLYQRDADGGLFYFAGIRLGEW